MIVEPFRTEGAGTYHTNTLCPVGKAIPSGRRRSGDGGLTECEVCRPLAGIRLALGGVEESLHDDLRVLAEAEVQGGFGILIWCPDSDQILLSEGAYEIHGLTPEGPMVPTDLVAAVVHPDDLSLVESGLASVAKGGNYDVRHRVVWPDGTIRWVRATARLKAETGTSPAYILGTVVDITDYVDRK